jgi:hypothetical protein
MVVLGVRIRLCQRNSGADEGTETGDGEVIAAWSGGFIVAALGRVCLVPFRGCPVPS